MAQAICGVWHRDEADVNAVEPMLAALPGQGEAGQLDLGAARFGFRNLWAASATEDGRGALCSRRELTIAADARLDNRSELAEALGVAGPEKTGPRDGQLILRAYERWGADCPVHLQGDYAFAVWDSGRRELFCARDAVGARPFYYSLEPGRRFTFASDAAAALAAPGVADELDEAHVAAFLMGGANDIGGTFFRAVRSLPPGHSITVGADSERVRRWWCPENAPAVHGASDEDYARQFLDLYKRAVRDRLRDAQPLGVHLSGGLDSSSIAVLAARELRPAGDRPHAFCWHPPPGKQLAEDEADEYRLIEAVCAQEQLAPRYHAVSVNHVLAMLRRDGVRFPNRDGTLGHEVLVQRSAAELGVRVILSGWGGDEVASYSGAGYYAELLREGNLARLMQEARELSNRPWRFIVRNALLPLAHPRAAHVAAKLLRGEMPRRRGGGFAHPDLARKHGKPRTAARTASVRATQLERLNLGHLAQRMEDWGSSGARLGIEYRYPLLDRRLIEFVLGLPPEQFRSGPRSRWFMRRALRSVLPAKVLEQSVKSDPARYRPLGAATDEALLAVLQQLDARAEPPVRAGYVEMVKLRAALEARRTRGKRTQPGKLSRALAFLDWQAE